MPRVVFCSPHIHFTYSITYCLQSIVGTRPLELRFQPDNPYLSALVAERQNMAELSSGRINLVMRVRRKKSDPNASCTVECLGVVSIALYCL